MGHGMEELRVLPSRDCGHGHEMAKASEFPSRALKNKKIKVTRWHETGIMPSREHYPYHGMAKTGLLPSRDLHIGDT